MNSVPIQFFIFKWSKCFFKLLSALRRYGHAQYFHLIIFTLNSQIHVRMVDPYFSKTAGDFYNSGYKTLSDSFLGLTLANCYK